MDRRLRRRVLAAVGLLALTQGGCTFFACSGGGPLRRDELGDWAGLKPLAVPEPKALEAKLHELKAIRLPSFRPFPGEYAYTEGPHWLSTSIPDPWDLPFAPTRGYVVKGTYGLWLRGIPSWRPGHWIHYVPSDPAARQFYATESVWGMGLFFGDFVFSSSRVDAFDVGTRERVAAQKMEARLGWWVGWSRLRRIMPVDAQGRRGLHALRDPRVALDGARYELKDGNCLLLGLIGWGRVNRRCYLQIFWIPIPIARAGD